MDDLQHARFQPELPVGLNHPRQSFAALPPDQTGRGSTAEQGFDRQVRSLVNFSSKFAIIAREIRMKFEHCDALESRARQWVQFEGAQETGSKLLRIGRRTRKCVLDSV
jgi:hypothetical protein